jgi:Mrp family chromosome partitioning ATPase/NifU-like protein involved in Fe-S cluster formation
MNTSTETQTKITAPMPQKGTAEDYNNVKNVIAVMSGKGGVGKSLVTGLLASALTRRGYQVGLLDADITGPSIPMLFGLHGPVEVGAYGIGPLTSRTGIKIISMNLLLPSEEQPVIWRGPLVSHGIRQLWGDVMWGDLDYLLIDLPPGTSDATLTIMQSLPVNGLVMVTTPQSLASMVVTKAINMAQITKVDIIGIIENMAYFDCPDNGSRYYIFGNSHAAKLAEKAKAPMLAQIPIDPSISSYCDAGNVEEIDFDGLESLVDRFLFAAESKDELQRMNQSVELEEMPGVDVAEPNDRTSGDEDEPALSAYTPIAQEIIRTRENMGKFETPDLSGGFRGCCGDSIHYELLLDGEIVRDARFTTDGCSATIAVGGMLTRMLKGKTLDYAREIDSITLIEALGGLLKGHLHCAELAIKALRETIGVKSEG